MNTGTTATSPLTRADAVTWLTLYAAILLLIPTRLGFPGLGSAGAPSLWFGLCSLLLWLMFRAAASQPLSEPHAPIRIAVGVFLLSVGISYVLAMKRPISPDEVSPADLALIACASWTGTMLVADQGITNRPRLDTLIWRLVLLGGVVAALGILQIITARLWVDQLSIPGLVSSQDYALLWRGTRIRPSGTATHPIEFGVLITMILPLALHVGVHQKDRSKILRWFPAAAIMIIVPLTSSRSALVGAAIGLVIAFFGWPARERRVLAGFGGAGLLALVVTSPGLLWSIVNMFTGAGDDPSIQSRTDSFGVAMQFLAAEPLFGRGLGTFLPKYRIFDNEYLLMLVSIGIVGTMCFLAIGVVASIALLWVFRNVTATESRCLAMSLVAAVAVGFTGMAMFDAFAFPMTMGTLFLILGIAGAFHRLEFRSRGEPSPSVHLAKQPQQDPA